MLVQEVIDNHKNRMMLIESRQKDYNFLINECKQLCEDKHYASDKVNYPYIHTYIPTYVHIMHFRAETNIK